MSITIDLTGEQQQLLRDKAARLGISTQELVSVAIKDLLAERDERFKSLLNNILDENEELHRRLA